MTTSFTIQGYDQLLMAVRQLPDKMKKREIIKMMKINMTPLSQAIKTNAPIEKEGRTIKRRDKSGRVVAEYEAGNLKKSIGLKSFTKGEEVSVYAGIQNKKSADGYYGLFLERGTKNQSPKPFIEPAARKEVPLATHNLSKDIAKYIAKNATRLGLNASTP